MKSFATRMIAPALLALLLGGCTGDTGTKRAGNPNVVIIFLDDSGWSDFPPFGLNTYPTPNVERLAREGRSYHQFIVPQGICSASRAALLTGCYPQRTRVFGAHGPRQRGLDPGYATLGEVLQKQGYRTAVFGKWHVGDQPDTRPPARGFDESAGIMYSNDMWAAHPENPEYWGQFPLQYWENGDITIDSVTGEHQKMFTTWFTEKAVDFIGRHAGQPFFLYLPHPQPHVPLFCSDKFAGASGTGLHGDVMMEIDWSVGQILQALERHGLEKHTLVLMTSDNGPWHVYGNHAGKTPFREAKGTSFEGGIRSALIARYPGHLEAGSRSPDLFCSIDLLPTIAHLTGAALPENEIDGRNVWDLMRGAEGAANPHGYYAVTTVDHFDAVISGDGRWKLHLPHPYRHLVYAGKDGRPGKYIQQNIDTALFDLLHDPQEKGDVRPHYPEVTARLLGFAQEHRQRFFGAQP
jgi:arylsulfatase A